MSYADHIFKRDNGLVLFHRKEDGRTREIKKWFGFEGLYLQNDEGGWKDYHDEEVRKLRGEE